MSGLAAACCTCGVNNCVLGTCTECLRESMHRVDKRIADMVLRCRESSNCHAAADCRKYLGGDRVPWIATFAISAERLDQISEHARVERRHGNARYGESKRPPKLPSARHLNRYLP